MDPIDAQIKNNPSPGSTSEISQNIGKSKFFNPVANLRAFTKIPGTKGGVYSTVAGTATNLPILYYGLPHVGDAAQALYNEATSERHKGPVTLKDMVIANVVYPISNHAIDAGNKVLGEWAQVLRLNPYEHGPAVTEDVADDGTRIVTRENGTQVTIPSDSPSGATTEDSQANTPPTQNVQVSNTPAAQGTHKNEKPQDKQEEDTKFQLGDWASKNVVPDYLNKLPYGHSLFGALAGGAIGAGIGGLNYLMTDENELSEEEKMKRSLARAMLSSAGIGMGIGGVVGGVSDFTRPS